MTTYFTAREVHGLKEGIFRVIKPISGVPQGALAKALDGRKMPGGWLVEVEWQTGPHQGSTECLTRGEMNNHLVREPNA